MLASCVLQGITAGVCSFERGKERRDVRSALSVAVIPEYYLYSSSCKDKANVVAVCLK